jgi:hypothetical protein
MSAFICTDETVNALAQLAPLDDSSLRQNVVNLLRAENTRSVNYRYNEDDAIEPVTYQPNDAVSKLTPVEILKLCNHFDYQASETDDYHESQAAKIVETIRRQAIENLFNTATRLLLTKEQVDYLKGEPTTERADTIRSLFGYADAPWGLG